MGLAINSQTSERQVEKIMAKDEKTNAAEKAGAPASSTPTTTTGTAPVAGAPAGTIAQANVGGQPINIMVAPPDKGAPLDRKLDESPVEGGVYNVGTEDEPRYQNAHGEETDEEGNPIDEKPARKRRK